MRNLIYALQPVTWPDHRGVRAPAPPLLPVPRPVSAHSNGSCRRFLNNKFPDDHKPTIEEFYRKLYRIRGEVYQMDVLDTSGHDPFPALRRTSYLTGGSDPVRPSV